jgi:hypothetical protein
LGINRFCVYDYPQVITNRPLIVLEPDIEIFPTLYWLTCPYLNKEVAQLEADGFIAQFEQRIDEDPEFAAAVRKNHADYAARRLALIPVEVRERMGKDYPQRYQVLAETGVGGTRNPHGVKCLHAHVADYLVNGENVIGAETVKLLDGKLDCEQASCRSFAVDEGI